jgi:hypothetical protein
VANVIRPPNNLTKAQRTRRSIYLAGPFVDDAWRDEMIAALADLEVDIYDPRNGVWETPAAADLSAGAFRGMLDWQLSNAADATVVAFWLPRGVPALTATLQLGSLAAKRGGAKRGSSVIVGPEGEPTDIVRAFVASSRVFLMPTVEAIIRGARYQLTRTDGL